MVLQFSIAHNRLKLVRLQKVNRGHFDDLNHHLEGLLRIHDIINCVISVAFIIVVNVLTACYVHQEQLHQLCVHFFLLVK